MIAVLFIHNRDSHKQESRTCGKVSLANKAGSSASISADMIMTILYHIRCDKSTNNADGAHFFDSLAQFREL